MANMAQALRMALHYGEKNLEVKDIFGEDVGAPLGGVFTVSQGLKTAWNSPLDERGIVGAAMGIAMTGDRCVAEIQFCDYIFNTVDLLKMVGNTHWIYNGTYNLPLVLMTPTGAGIHGSIYHSHSIDAMASRLPGWKIVMPSNPLDAYGLMISAIKDPNPVMFLKPKALLRVRGEEHIPGEPASEKELKSMIDKPVSGDVSKWKPTWPKGLEEYEVPIGKARISRAGTKATLVTYGKSVLLANKVADELAKEGTDIEVIDLRSIYPYDWQAIKESVRKTGRVMFVNEDTEVTNFAEHLSYRTTTELFYELMARPRVLAGKNLPVGLHADLEDATIPTDGAIMEEMRALLAERP